MTPLSFTKMHAQGNDFVVLDGRRVPLPKMTPALARRLCDRRLGIGCDQLLLLLPATQADARMRIFNQDGSEAGNCGNGLRCCGWLICEERGSDCAILELSDRRVKVERIDKARMRAHMGKAFVRRMNDRFAEVDIGNLHRVYWSVEKPWPTDVNIEIVSGLIGDHAYVDVIERGVGHTPACGSGACAVAAAIWAKEACIRPITVHMPGGEMAVSGDLDDLLLEGEVVRVFEGRIDIPASH